MKWYSNLKIATKQLLGYLVLFALTCVLGISALHGLGTVRGQAAELAERGFPITEAFSELRSALFQYRVAEMGFAFMLEPDERDLRKFKMEQGQAQAQALMEKLKLLLRTSEEKKLFDAVDA